MESSELQIKYVPVNELVGAGYNPREITTRAFNGLKASIKRWKVVEPILRNSRTNVIIGGHMRLQAAIELELKTVPVIDIDLSPEEEKALNVVLNNTRIQGHYTDALQDILEDIRLEIGDMAMGELVLDELVLKNSWDDDKEKVDETSAHLNGIKATIKVKCPTDIKDDVLVILKRAFIETSLEGVEIV